MPLPQWGAQARPDVSMSTSSKCGQTPLTLQAERLLTLCFYAQATVKTESRIAHIKGSVDLISGSGPGRLTG